jgi:hypothetical protein
MPGVQNSNPVPDDLIINLVWVPDDRHLAYTRFISFGTIKGNVASKEMRSCIAVIAAAAREFRFWRKARISSRSARARVE